MTPAQTIPCSEAVPPPAQGETYEWGGEKWRVLALAKTTICVQNIERGEGFSVFPLGVWEWRVRHGMKLLKKGSRRGKQGK